MFSVLFSPLSLQCAGVRCPEQSNAMKYGNMRAVVDQLFLHSFEVFLHSQVKYFCCVAESDTGGRVVAGWTRQQHAGRVYANLNQAPAQAFLLR